MFQGRFVFKFALFINVLLFSINSFGVECDNEQESNILKHKVFHLPSNCTLNKGMIRTLKYQHALAYGDTDIVEQILDSSFWRNVLDFDRTYEKIHLYNLHGSYTNALNTLKKIDPSTTDKSYILALSETNLKMGNLAQADFHFQTIESKSFTELPSPQYILLHLELLYHRKDYQSLNTQAEKYIYSLLKAEGTGTSGYDSNMLAWFLIGRCLVGKVESEKEKEEDVEYLRSIITSSYSIDSVFYQEQERIIGLCN